MIAGCIALLERRDADADLVIALGGPPAMWVTSDDAAGGPAYWLRVWAARGLLWVWDDSAVAAILAHCKPCPTCATTRSHAYGQPPTAASSASRACVPSASWRGPGRAR